MKPNVNRKTKLALSCLLVMGISGCMSRYPEPVVEEYSSSPLLGYAEALYEAGRYSDAIVEVSAIARKDPLTPGLTELQDAIMRTLGEERRRAMTMRRPRSEDRMLEDVLGHNVVPDTYRLRRNIKGESGPLRTDPSRMQEALAAEVTVHLDNVDLAAFADQIARSQGINIVADGNLGGATMTIHAEDTPLIEILEYVGRNLGVTFSVGNNLIWATESQDRQGSLPLETRVYRLRKGLAGDELSRPQSGGGGGGGGGAGGRAAQAAQRALGSMLPGASGGGGGGGGENEPAMMGIIERFVPQPEGADILFNNKAHVLVVRNTRSNLQLTEDIIDALDVIPPQVLIEARFISAAVDDLSELGVEWIMDSPYAIRHSRGRTKTQIMSGASLGGFTPSDRETAGLNFAFQGVLTDPQFRAIVHILETSGKSRTLSVPRVTTINNRPANIRVGQDFRYYEEYDLESYDTVQGTGNNATTVTRTQLVPVGSPTLEELGIELSVTPSVGSDMASINLALIPEISNFVRWEYYEMADDDLSQRENLGDDKVSGGTGMLKLPVFQRSRIETDVVVRSGETIVMGGLIRSVESKRREGVPILSHIPFLGQLFRRDGLEEERENLIIFVTATLISELGEELIPLEEFTDSENLLHDGVGASPAAGVGDGGMVYTEGPVLQPEAAEDDGAREGEAADAEPVTPPAPEAAPDVAPAEAAAPAEAVEAPAAAPAPAEAAEAPAPAEAAAPAEAPADAPVEAPAAEDAAQP